MSSWAWFFIPPKFSLTEVSKLVFTAWYVNMLKRTHALVDNGGIWLPFPSWMFFSSPSPCLPQLEGKMAKFNQIWYPPSPPPKLSGCQHYSLCWRKSSFGIKISLLSLSKKKKEKKWTQSYRVQPSKRPNLKPRLKSAKLHNSSLTGHKTFYILFLIMGWLRTLILARICAGDLNDLGNFPSSFQHKLFGSNLNYMYTK